jgi:hypothetical protein
VALKWFMSTSGRLLSRVAPLAALSAALRLVSVGVAAPDDPIVVERGPHHRVIERTITEKLPDGTVAERKSSYTELATGLHYLSERGEWLDSKEEIEIFQGAAVARRGQHQVIFAAQLNSPGAIDLATPDGKRFRSHVLGLAYTDGSGHSVLIAEVKDSVGAVLPPNLVFYQDAFAGDCMADVRYTYTKSAFEQDVIILTAPPPPQAYGLDPATARLEVWTEFIESPEGTMTAVVLKREYDPVARQQMVEPDLIDQRLDFGVMKMEQGQAFPLGEADPFSGAAVPTGKSMERIDGRVFLIEKVDYRDVREHLKALPQQAAANPRRKVVDPVNGQRLFAGMLPPAPKGERGAWRANQVAKLNANRKGFVLDYVTLNSSLTNYTFKADSTYFLTNNNTVNLYGTTVIEGGTVIKGAGLAIRGPLDCRTSPYRPATWTSRDDDTIGEIIAGSTGSPTSYTGTMLNLFDTSAICDLHDFRMAYAYYGIIVNAGVKADLSHFQIVKSRAAVGLVSTSIANCRNFLFYDLALLAFPITGTVTNRSEHGTFHVVANFRQTTNAASPFGLTNCLLISVTNNVLYTGTNVVRSLDDTGFFQTVGASSHYLSSGSTNRNAGTTNINPGLLATLSKKTTYPPIVLSNAITTDTTLTAQAQRDTDTPDIGYHPDPLDYVASQIAVTNATLTLQTGTALGVYGSSSAPGLVLLDGGKVISEGAPDNLNRIVRYNLVQEQATTNWSASSVGKSISTPGTYSTNTYTGEVRLRFTDFSMPANGNDHLYTGATNLAYSVKDCQFHGGQLTSLRPDVTLLNNLFDRVAFKLYAPVNGFTALVRNGTHFGGSVTVSNVAGGTWTVRDNLFDTTNLVQNGTVGNNYNGYLTNGVRLTPTNVTDVKLTVTSIAYDTGRLGRFYLPTNLTSHSPLFNSGSENATNAGLYHFTAVTNQTRELTTTVDLGFHSVAVNITGQPIDTDGDGLADYFEDANGNGSKDTVETNWQSADSDGDGVNDFDELAQGRNALQPGWVPDLNGFINLETMVPRR